MRVADSPTLRRKPALPVKAPAKGKNGNGNGATETAPAFDMRLMLRALQAVRDGDFSVRLPSDQTGLAGKIADTFNEIVLSNQQMAQELERVGQTVGKEGKTKHRMTGNRRSGSWDAMQNCVNTLIEDLLWPTTEVTRTISAVAKGDLSQTMPLEVDGRPLAGRVPALRDGRQRDDPADERVHVRGHARGARGRHRRQARRPGGGAGCGRHLEGPDRQRQFHGQQPDRPGPQHLGSHDRGRQRRPVAQDHGRRARRDPAAQGSHQHDGRSAALVRLRSHARGARGRHRGQARRPGDRARRRRHLEGPDRLGQRHGHQPHRPGAQHRRGHHRGGARRSVAQDHRGRARARFCSSRTPSTRWSISSTASPPKSRAWRARSAPRASSAARPR